MQNLVLRGAKNIFFGVRVPKFSILLLYQFSNRPILLTFASNLFDDLFRECCLVAVHLKIPSFLELVQKIGGHGPYGP